MTWTYGTDASDDLNAVRDAVGDTVLTDPLISDEVIQRCIDLYGVVRSGPVVARRIAARFARMMTKSSGPVRIQWTDRFNNYMKLAEDLQTEISAPTSDAVPWGMAGADLSDDYPNSIFTRHMGERYPDYPVITTGVVTTTSETTS